ncbi:DNA topoisomerase IV, alpha subunit [Annulohypoxylon truncatum]|uniref:DNA topoisomerase IV, alpha subunit n=1 Tax=Annulohypoxylon truncatum TaxID=327061 RepID=UPI002007C86E|nr:DNA topoisomerase IV, alpha subunit [Annulohypoxylon truncatum]KAI1206884.1 DNA topoisomerase IV, alpha subunit [Annulohypoxylon truncatum]
MSEQQDYNTVANARDATQDTQGRTVISKIESILEDIIDALSENRILTIPLRSRRSGNENLIRFPANTGAEVKRFTCLLQILHMCHEALVSGHVITKRNIYYQNPDLFGNQPYVDNLVDDVAFTFGVGRDVLNIVAAYKGLVAGNITIRLKSNSVLDCSSDHNGILIPHAETIHQIDIGEAKWVMVIEKEATFRGLAASRYYETSAAGAGLLITGKGYPDLVTRQFLHLLDSAFPQVPIHALVDFDPSGIDIMLTYKHGSRSLSHEENITTPRLSWLGPKGCHILGHTNQRPSVGNHSQTHQSFDFTPPSNREMLIPPPSVPVSSANPVQVLSNLTAFDRRKATNLLSRLIKENNEMTDTNMAENGLVCELQLMLMLNLKAEIQAVDDAGDLTGWLDEKLSDGQY